MRTILVGLLLAGSVAAQCSGPSSVFGYVRLDESRALVNASVQLEAKLNGVYVPVNGVRTMKRGYYEFSLDPCVTYRLHFTSKRFDITNLLAVPFGGDSVRVDAEAWER